MAGDTDDIIDSAVVRVAPDLRGFRTKLKKDLAAALKGVEGSVKIRLVADKTGFAASVRQQLKTVRTPEFKVRLVADASGFAASAKRAAASVGETSKKVNQQTTRDHQQNLTQQVGNQRTASAQQTRILEQQARQAQRIAERQAKQQAAARARGFRDLRTGPQLIDYGGRGIRPTNLLLGTVVAMTPALFAMASSAAQASTSIAALGSASIGAAFGIGGLAIAFQGLGDALTLRKTVQDEAITAAAQAVEATDDLARARRALADAQRDERQANADIHRSRVEAVRDLVDLRQAVRNLNNEFKDDSLTLEEKRRDESATLRNFFATSLEKRRATQDRRNAEVALADTALQRKQKTEDLKTSVRKGIEGSDRVRDARERARDARDRTLDARDSLKQQQKAAGGVVDKTSSAAAKLKQRLAEMAPAARDIYYWFERNEESLKRMQRSIAQAVLPGFYDFLQAVSTPARGKTTLQLAAQYAGELGAIISKYVGVLGEWTRSDFFRTRMARIQETNARAFDTLGRAVATLSKPLLRIIDRSAPGFESMADAIERFAIWFDKVIERADRNGSLAKWFEDAREAAGKWFDLAGNIIGIVGDLFRASLPAGGSLLDQFRAFTQNIQDFTSSAEGQRQIRAFFDKIASLPFAKIADFFVNATLFFAAFRTLRFLKELNPFFLAFAAFSAANPAGAARAFELIGSAVGTAVGYLASNPAAAATLLSIMAAAKLGKTVGFDIKIPVVNSLRDALVSRFKVLDKFVGGGAQTATMNVQAGVVNVNGPIAGAGGKAGKTGKVGGGAAGAAAAGGGALVTGLVAAAVAAGLFATSGFKDAVRDEGLLTPFKEFTKDPSWKSFANTLKVLSPVYVAGYGLGKLQKTAQDNEKRSFGNAQLDAVRSYTRNRITNDPTVVNRDAVRKYIEDRRKSVAALVEQTKATKGQAQADRVLYTETQASARSLSYILQMYGYTKTKADSYANAVTGLNELQYKAQQATNAAGDATETAGNKAKTAAGKAKLLADQLKQVEGTKTITLKIDGEEKVFADLNSAVAFQQIIKRGLPATESNLNKYKRQITDKNTYADGGRVNGYSPNPRADNIPAMLTANEYVQPVAAVKHYGTDFMEAVRTRRLPKFAAGGPVGNQSWPFVVKMPDAMAAITPHTDAYMPIAGGTATGNVTVAETAEATARAMGATTKQLVALIEAGLVESGLRNLNYGDRDSVGFLQQRASWGSLKARMDVATATRKFISKARRVDSPKLTAGQLAQAVQVSAFPDRYAEREADAVAVLNRFAPTLAGYGPTNTSGGALPGTWQGLWAMVKNQFPKADLFSAFRKGSRTLSGNLSRHSLGKAIDTNAWRSLAEWIYRSHGTSSYELISPWTNLNLYKGKPHKYSRAVEIQHGAHGDPTRNAHVHWSTYDQGGVLPPGFTLAYNGTGRNETIRTAEQEQQLGGPLRIDRRDLAQLASLIAGAASTGAITMDGRKVAETTNRYNYLPAGV